MSQYLNVHLRDENGKFHYLTSYSRSTSFYSAAEAPYEKVIKYTAEDFLEMAREFEDYARGCDATIKNYKEQIEFLSTCQLSRDELLDAFREAQVEIRGMEMEKDELQRWIATAHVYADIASDIESDCSIYMGIEISEPTEEDIIGE